MKTLNTSKNFLAIEKEFSSYDTSAIAIVSAPYEATVSYGKGTGKGPEAILKASAYVEFYDDEFDRELCFEKGIATLRPLAFGKSRGADMLRQLDDAVTHVINEGKFCVTLGGEHTISTAPIAAHFRKFPTMSILHFDAHSDLRDEYEGTPYSHACFMSRVAEFFPTERITQVGIRAQCREEAEFIKSRNLNTFYASAIRRGLHGADWQTSVVNTLSNDVYVTFDVDYFDPSVMPATGTPEPDGFHYAETLDIFRKLIASGKRIVGFDIVELAPDKSLPHSSLTTARLLYKMLNYAFAVEPKPKRSTKSSSLKTKATKKK
ncbi:MAG: agmatinase [Candidatus Kapabacteria bacterium]|nr:agmatinase [Candidatus Kapabacteria bacterium]